MRQVKSCASAKRSTFTSLLKFLAGAYLACSVIQSTHAAPHFGDEFNLAQPDGSMVPVRVFGDEYYQRIETPDGYTLVRNKAGWIVYAEQNAAGNLEPSSSVYSASGGMVGLVASGFDKTSVKKSLTNSTQEQERIRAANLQKFNSTGVVGASTRALNVSESDFSQPVLGDIKGMTILIDFSDEQAVIPQADIDAFFNDVNYTGYGNNGSIRDYFYDVSGGKLTYTNDVTVYYRAQNPKTYYDTSDESRTKELLTEAIEWLEGSGYDFSQLSLNSGGQILGLNVFYAGVPTQGWSNGLWPHSGYYSDGAGSVGTYRYQITNIGTDLSIAVTCHENGHLLMGWVDLYNKFSEPSRGIGIYGLMAGYANHKNPLPPNPYNRALAAWQEPTYISSTPGDQTITLTANTYESYAYENPDVSSEFFMIEAIQITDPTSRYYYGPGEGVLIWHVDEYGNNSDEEMTDALHYKVSVEQADGLFDLEMNVNSGDASDYYTNSTVKNFDSESIPNSNWWDGSKSGLTLSNFSAPGSSMSVDVSVESVGWLQYEAEYQAYGQAVTESINSGYSGVGYVNTDNVLGSWVEFSVDLPYEGLYSMRFRYANGTSFDRPVDIAVNGELASQGLNFVYTGSWTAWAHENVSLNMQAGLNTLRLISNNAAGAGNIDYLQILVEEVDNLPPVLSKPIGDIVIGYGQTFLIDLNSVFVDPEGGELEFSRESSDDESPNLMFEGPTHLRVSGLQEGTESHYISAMDTENTFASDSFSLTVLPANQFYVELQVEDQSWQNGVVEADHSGFTGEGYLNTENAVGTWLELEVEAPSQGQYLFSVRYANGGDDRPQQVNVNGNIAHDSVSFAPTGGWASWSNREFEVTLAAGVNYVRLISLGANGAANLDSFTVELLGSSSNNAPVVIAQKEPVLVSEVGDDYVHDMAAYFSDPDGDTLGFSASSSDTNVVSVNLDGSVIIITGEGAGNAVVFVTATDGEYSVTMTFDASVPGANSPPLVVNTINDIRVVLGSAPYVIDLNFVFSDPDGDVLTFDLDSSNSDSTNLSFVNNATEIEVRADQLGSEWYEVTASDGEFQTTVQFNLEVLAANLPPVIDNPIDDVQMNLGDAAITIDLNTVFSDPEGGVLTFDHYPADEELDDVTLLAGGLLQIDAEYAGTNSHTIYAIDDQSADTFITFNVTVVAGGGYSVVLEAEDQVWLNGSVDTNHTGFTGSGFLNTENAIGTWFQVTVDVPVAGAYSFAVRYANGSTSRSQQVDVDGDLGPLLSFDNSGGWAAWVEEVFVVPLSPGVHTITFTSTTSGGAPNVDSIGVTLQ